MKWFRVCVISVVLMSSAASAQDDHHEDDVVVGRTAAGRLSAEFAFESLVVLPAVQGVLSGFALDEPGFTSLESDEATEDFFRMANGADLALEIVQLSPALSLWSPGFATRLQSPGDRWILGSDPFDEHLTWHIDTLDSAFNVLSAPWSATFRLLDLGTTAYATSSNYTISFVPEPGTFFLLAAVGFMVAWRGKHKA